MTRTKLFAAAAILSSIVATPVLARDGSPDSHLSRKQVKAHHLPHGDRHVHAGYRTGYNRADSGFFPVDVAAGVVGGVVGTAGAIAAAPFAGNDRYAYDNGWDNRRYYRGSYASIDNHPRVGALATAPNNNPYDLNRVGRAAPFVGQDYALRNGFVCVPGTVFTNVNGIRTLCQ